MNGKPKNPMRAEISHDLCVGVAMCVQLAPKAFVLNEAGQALFKPDGDWTPDDLREAADGCPMMAITVLGGIDWKPQ